MKKIISTLTAMTFALGLAAAAQAQIAKTPEKPEVKSTQTQVTPQEPAKAGEPATKEATKTGDKTKEMVKPGDKEKAKHTVGKETKKVTKQGGAEKKAGAPMETTPAAK